jgi:peptide/nickel transport system substrate-binding protein
MPGTRHAATAAAVALLALASGCGSGGGSDSTSDSTSRAEPAAGGTFSLALASDPGDLNPAMTPSSVARTMLSLAYDTLVFQREDGEIVSGLASRWEATPRSATFTLRDDVQCADGSRLTASDVADNVNFITNPRNRSPLLGVLVNPGVRASGDDAAGVVTVRSPTADGFLLTSMASVFIVCRGGLDDPRSISRATNGTGPWQLDEAVPDDHYSFVQHRGYAWGPDGARLGGPGTPDSVNVRIVPNITTTANLLLSGEVNVGDVNGPDAERLRDGFTTIDTIETSGETWFNHTAGRPGADPVVRRALATGTDMTELANVATGGNGQPSRGFITLQPNQCSGGDTVSGNLPAFDVEAAKTLLEEGGWRAGADGVRSKDGRALEISFIYDAKGQDARTAGAELLASQWEDLGAKVELRALPEAQLNEQLFGTGAWDVAWATFTFNLPSQMVAFVSGPTPSEGGANFPAIGNEQYSADAARATGLVGKESCPVWADAEVALLRELDLVPMFDSVNKTYVKNAELTSVGGQIWGSSLRLLAG